MEHFKLVSVGYSCLLSCLCATRDDICLAFASAETNEYGNLFFPCGGNGGILAPRS